MEVGEAQRLQSLGLGQCLSNAYFRSHTEPCRLPWQVSRRLIILSSPILPVPGVAAMSLELVVIAGPDQGKTFVLNAGKGLMLGRSAQAQYQINDPRASRNHC